MWKVENKNKPENNKNENAQVDIPDNEERQLSNRRGRLKATVHTLKIFFDSANSFYL